MEPEIPTPPDLGKKSNLRGGGEGNTTNFDIIKSNLPRPVCTYRRQPKPPLPKKSFFLSLPWK